MIEPLYESIQDTAPDNLPLGELIAYLIWECHKRGVHHAGQQNYIIEKVLASYAYT